MHNGEHAWRAKLTLWATDENLDLWLLMAAAGVFTVLGIVGVAGESVLASAILALLAFMAFALIRSRRDVASIKNSQTRSRTSILAHTFPDELNARRLAAKEVLVIGGLLARTVAVYGRDLRKRTDASVSIRWLVTDPAVFASLAQVHPQYADQEDRIRSVLKDLRRLLNERPEVKVRLAPFVIPVGLNVLDPQSPNGFVVAQHVEFRPEDESAPIITLLPGDGYWFERTVRHAERMWDASTPWPAESPAT